MAELGKGHEYKISEGNQIGYLPTEFGTNQAISEKKIVAGTGGVEKGRVVELTDELTVAHTSASSANVLGVAMFTAEEGEPVAVETEGVFKLIAASAITAPCKVDAAADGKVAATAGSGTVNPIGLALTDATTDGYVYVKFSI